LIEQPPYDIDQLVSHPDHPWASAGFRVLSLQYSGPGRWTLHVTDSSGGGYWLFRAEEVEPYRCSVRFSP
jgi:hypothetical protein